MAIELEIQVRNGKIRITVGGGHSNAHGRVVSANAGGPGGSSPPDPSDQTGGGGPKRSLGGSSPPDPSDQTGGGETSSTAGWGNGTTVIGPIVFDGSVMQGQNGMGGTSPSDPSDQTGGGGRPGLGGSSPGDPSDQTGGGGPLSAGGRGYGTTVIGPIVFTGGYSASGDAPCDASESTQQMRSHAVTVNPPQLAAGSNTTPVASFAMQPQQQSNWCWAAVTASINAFLDDPTPPMEQGAVATELLESQGISSPNCSTTPCPSVCNQPEALNAALAIAGNLRQNGYLPCSYLTFDCLQNWINEQLPVAARITWFGNGNGAHFIALTGCKTLPSGQQQVYVQDPDQSTPSTSPGFIDYDELVANYGEAGYWSDTYLVIA